MTTTVRDLETTTGTASIGLVIASLCWGGCSSDLFTNSDIAELSISPSEAEVRPDETIQLEATARDDNGNVITDAPIGWSSSSPAVANVSDGGLVTAVSVGRTTVTASANSVGDSSLITVSPEWTFRENEPSDYATLAEDDYNNTEGWGIENLDGTALIAADSTSPVSPPGVYRTVFTSGMSDGLSAANSSAILGGTYPELYVAFTFKAESDFEFHSNAIKHFLFFVDDGSGSNVQGFTYITTPDGDLTEGRQDMYMNPTTEQITSSKPEGRVEAGQWHQVEVQFVVNQSGSNTGILRIWLNGTLIIEDTNFENPGNGVTEVKFANTWGGGGQEVPKDQYIDVGHVYVSGISSR